VPPLFLGKGPIDFTCTSCDVILAKGVWAHSISGVVVECPKCRALSLFVAPSAPMAQRLLLVLGHFNFSGHVAVRQGIVIDGDGLREGRA